MTPLIINNQITNYMIDESGDVYNINTKKRLQGTIRSGYRMVKLTIDGKKKDYSVHRLVALTFIPNPNNLPQVNHIDRDKLNNKVTNLEWVSASKNMFHISETGGRKERKPILPVNEVIDGEHGWKQFQNTNYWVNKDGRVANKKTMKFLNPCKSKDGYIRYYLFITGNRKVYLAHRLIFETFSGSVIEKNMQINHIDGNKSNNSFSNLEKVTRQQNVQHSYYTLGKKVKPIFQCDLEGNIIAEFPSINAAARQLDFNDSGIVQACKGKIKTYKGFIWRYKEV